MTQIRQGSAEPASWSLAGVRLLFKPLAATDPLSQQHLDKALSARAARGAAVRVCPGFG